MADIQDGELPTPVVEEASVTTEESWLSALCCELFHNPVNLAILAICAVLVYKLFKGRNMESEPPPNRPPDLPPLKRQDMTLAQLKQYNGAGPDRRVCVSVNGKIFDVTKGTRFYGVDGPYHAFAGRDASRGLATFSVEVPKDEYDDLSDLNSMQMESVREWEMQFREKYHYVGRLLRDGEEPTDYSDEEDASQEQNQKPEVGHKTQEKSSDKTKDE